MGTLRGKTGAAEIAPAPEDLYVFLQQGSNPSACSALSMKAQKE
jgi:hypothetical protein